MQALNPIGQAFLFKVMNTFLICAVLWIYEAQIDNLGEWNAEQGFTLLQLDFIYIPPDARNLC